MVIAMKCRLQTAVHLFLAAALAFSCTSCEVRECARAETQETTATASTAAPPTTTTAATTTRYTIPPIDGTSNSIEAAGYSSLISKVKKRLTNYSGSVLIAYQDTVIYADGFGYADKTKDVKNTMNTTFEIGSVTKQFTAAAILQLRDKRKLSVYDTLDKYFPDYRYGSEISIKNLLQMRSGIPDFLDDPADFYAGKSVIDEFYKKLSSNGTFDDNFVMSHLNDKKLLFEPNNEYSYSSTNYYLLSKIIEKVSGMSYEQYLKKYLFDPAGMTNSSCGFQASTSKGNGGAGFYASYPMNMILGAGCISTNVADLLKWNAALYHGQIVSEDSFADMISFVDGYGYGLARDGNYIGHSGSTLSFTTEFFKDPSKDLTVMLLSNETQLSDGSSLGDCLHTIESLCAAEKSFK